MNSLKCLQPATLSGVTLRNRLIVPPMVTYLGNEQGTMTDELVAYARARARGGFGLYILEATYIDRSGCGFSRGVGIDSDDKLPGLRKIVDAVHAEGGKISVQLHHAGRETTSSVTGCRILAPSDCPVGYSDEAVREMTREDIAFVVRRFGEAAARAVKAGFDAVMLHGAHGYLLSQFLSPYTNKRTDEYGGSLENRLRISLEVISAVREAVGPDFPVSYRMSVEEASTNGITLQDACKAAAILSRSGINNIHVVAGNYDNNELIIAPACYGTMVNRARARAIRQAVGPDFSLTVTGRVTSVYEAEALIREGVADFVAMGRASLADPELPKRSLEGRTDTVRACLGCNDACIGRTSKELSVGCAVNPATGNELALEGKKAAESRNILVIGAGPAGMEAAWLAARQGHHVVLAEKEASVGGQFRLAALPSHKDGIFAYLHNMVRRLEEEGVDLRLNCTVDMEFIRALHPDHVYIATGGTPIHVPFSGLDSVFTTTAQKVLTEDLAKLGSRVAVIGGGLVGCETAECIAATGRHVDVIEMQPAIIPELYPTVRNELLRRLAELKVTMHTDSKVMRIQDRQVIVADRQEKEHAIGPIDSVVMALGIRPNGTIEQAVKELGIGYAKIGDCKKQGNCYHATQSALAVFDD